MLDSPHTSAPMLMRGNTPPTTCSPPHQSRPRIPTQQTTRHCSEEERGGRGTTSKRTLTRAAPERRPPPTSRHVPQPRTSTTHPPHNKMQSTAYTSTNDLTLPAHSLLQASTGGHPQLADTSRGHPPTASCETPVVAGHPMHPGTGKGDSAGARPPRHATVMMLPFICSYRNKNEPTAIYPSFGYSPTRKRKEARVMMLPPLP